MDESKAAIRDFLAKDGQHDTTVHEKILPAVVNEHVTRTQLNEVQTVVQKEVHQDHYHTTVQPIKDHQVLPTEHISRVAKPEFRQFHHGNDGKVLEGVEAEKARFRNTREIGDIEFSKSVGPTYVGEHIHHHVHETIQPVVQKETVERSVIHTTIPVHEVHHNIADFQPQTKLPVMTMAEFQERGGVLGVYTKDPAVATTGQSQGLGKTMNPKSKHGNIGGKSDAGTAGITGSSSHGSAQANVANAKVINATSDKLAAMTIDDKSNSAATGTGTASVIGTQTGRSYQLASGSPSAPPSTSHTVHTTTTATNASTPGIGNTTTAAFSSNSNHVSRASTDLRKSVDGRKSKDLGHRRTGSSAQNSTGSKKEGLIAKIKHAIRND